MNKKLLLGLVVLVVAAGAVAYMYSNTPVSEKAPVVVNNQPAQPSQQNVPASNPPKPGDDTKPGAVPTTQSGLSADEKAALAAFGPGGDVNAQVALANKVAKETGVIDVSGCNFVPAVLTVKAGSNFSLVNKGAEEAVVTFFADNKSHIVAAGATTTVKASFGNGNGGLFGFYCRAGATTHQSAVLVY